MLRFAVFYEEKLVNDVDLTGAYLVGSDEVALRADITLKDGLITCEKRAAGPAGLNVLWTVEGVGRVMLETTRLPERDKPYVLTMELARGRLTRVNSKLEDWGLQEHSEAREVVGQLDKSRDLLIRALQADTDAEASRYGEESLALAVRASEELSRIHATALLQRRRQSSGFGRRVFGCAISLEQTSTSYRERLTEAFDFVSLPIVWREIEPREQTFNWKPLDSWVEYLAKKRVSMKGSALLSFSEANIPDWLYIWEHDFETIRDLAFEHVRRVMSRYSQYITVWDVVSGIHAQNSFTFNFEQLMELTRMATSAARQASSRCVSVVNITAPWGEYYAHNQLTIPPLLYADMVMQSGLNFEAFGLRFCFGAANNGMFARDMFQVSSILDQFGKLGKPLYLTAVQVPSQPASPPDTDADTENAPAGGGCWRGGWSEGVQSEWLRWFVELALSKPSVERVCWNALSDKDSHSMPHGGLLTSGLAPKLAYTEMAKLRGEIMGPKRRSARKSYT